MTWCVALNLRSSSMSVSPLLPLIKNDLALSYATTGFLFSIPTVGMAVFGMPGGWLADTLGTKRTLALGLVTILAGSALRATATGFLSLVLWTGLMGAGMGISGPGLTRLVKERFSDLPGTATGIYTSGLITGASLGSWLTVPYLLQWSGSWRATFLVWSGVACLTLLGWLLLAPAGAPPGGGSLPQLSGIWRDKTVWKLNTVFLLHNLFFYCVASWIPTYYHELGMTLQGGTLLLTLFMLVGLPSCLAIPYLSDRFGGRRAGILASNLIIIPTLLGMTFFPLAAPLVYVLIMGFSSGGIFALTFALPLDYVEPEKVGSVAGANFLVGYSGAFLGPLLMGLVHDWTASFTAAWLVVLVILAALMVTTLSLPRKPVGAR